MHIINLRKVFWVVLLLASLCSCDRKTNDMFDIPQNTDEIGAVSDDPNGPEAIIVGERGDYPQFDRESLALKHLDTEEYGYCSLPGLWMGENDCYLVDNTNRIVVVDYETGNRYPVCSRPNCSHNSKATGCMARYFDSSGEEETILFAYRYKSSLYVLTYSGRKRETKIYRSGLDGSNRSLLDTIPLEGFVAEMNYSGCLFGQAQANTGAEISIDGMGYTENVYYLVCFSAEDERFHIISDPLLDYNGNISVCSVEDQYIFYVSSYYSGQLAVDAEHFFLNCVYEYYRYDLRTGAIIGCTGDEKQFRPSAEGIEIGQGTWAFEIGLKSRLFTVSSNGKRGSITREAFETHEEPTEFE